MILGIILFILLVIFVIVINPKFDTKMQDIAKKYNVEWQDNQEDIDYCGGFKDLSIQNEISAHICNKGIMFIDGDYEKIRLVEWNKVQDIFIENEHQIQEQIKLSNIILFGALALGMDKKRKLINDEYIVLSLRENEDNNYNIILSSKDTQGVYDLLVETKNKFLNEYDS